ncbi:hypothetical protein U1Q18_016840 [Sarracenia purpurea var. burkii]
MKKLRPKQKREKHSIAFFSGFFSGCSICLLVAVVLLIGSWKLMDKEEGMSYIENIFPLYSLYAYIILHMLLYAANIYLWRRYRINYPFIFGFKHGTELGYREVFLLSNGLAVLTLATFLAHLLLKMDSRTRNYETYTELIPLSLLIVTLPDFFLADQLTSQVPSCSNAIVGFQLSIRTAYELRKGVCWKVLAVVSSAVATAMNTYWDIIIDWGLLQRQSRNSGLRDKLLVSHKSVYFAAMVLDVLMRFAWLQSVLKFNLHSLRGKSVTSIVSCLEILRRGMWNFFRLENEHLNNVGKYRAFKSVPLPFNYYGEDIEKDD